MQRLEVPHRLGHWRRAMGAVVGWLRGGTAVRVILFILLVNTLPAFIVLAAGMAMTMSPMTAV